MFIVPTVSQLSCRHNKRPEGLDREERQLWQNRRPHRSALHQRQAATARYGEAVGLKGKVRARIPQVPSVRAVPNPGGSDGVEA